MSVRGVWTIARQSLVRAGEGKAVPRYLLAQLPVAWQARPLGCGLRRCVHFSPAHASAPSRDNDNSPPSQDNGDSRITAEEIWAKSVESDDYWSPPKTSAATKWADWRARRKVKPPDSALSNDSFDEPQEKTDPDSEAHPDQTPSNLHNGLPDPSKPPKGKRGTFFKTKADRPSGWDQRIPRHLLPDFRESTAARQQQPKELAVLRLTKFPHHWSDKKIAAVVTERIQDTLPSIQPPRLVWSTGGSQNRAAMFQFASIEDADAARLSLFGLQVGENRRLAARFYQPGTRGAPKPSGPPLTSIRIVGLWDNVSLSKMRALFTHSSMPLPQPVHYFLYRRAPLPNGLDSAMAVVVFAAGTDVEPHMEVLNSFFRQMDVHISAHRPFVKQGPTRPGTRIVVTDYPAYTSLFDFYMAFSHVAPVEFVRFSGGRNSKCFCYIDFADEVDAMNAATYHNRILGNRRIWVRRVSDMAHIDDEVAAAKAAEAAQQAGLIEMTDPSSDPLSGEQTLMELK